MSVIVQSILTDYSNVVTMFLVRGVTGGCHLPWVPLLGDAKLCQPVIISKANKITGLKDSENNVCDL